MRGKDKVTVNPASAREVKVKRKGKREEEEKEGWDKKKKRDGQRLRRDSRSGDCAGLLRPTPRAETGRIHSTAVGFLRRGKLLFFAEGGKGREYTAVADSR